MSPEEILNESLAPVMLSTSNWRLAPKSRDRDFTRCIVFTTKVPTDFVVGQRIGFKPEGHSEHIVEIESIEINGEGHLVTCKETNDK